MCSFAGLRACVCLLGWGGLFRRVDCVFVCFCFVKLFICLFVCLLVGLFACILFVCLFGCL